MSDRLFPMEGTRPPGLPHEAQPGDQRYWPCPACRTRWLTWHELTYADCGNCGYTWRRSGQLHHSEKLPF